MSSRITMIFCRNPVRAKTARWPDEYEWCSFSAACKGDARCVDGYRFVYSVFCPLPWERVREMHEKSIRLVLEELADERLSGRAKEGLSVDDEEQQKARRRELARFGKYVYYIAKRLGCEGGKCWKIDNRTRS